MDCGVIEANHGQDRRATGMRRAVSVGLLALGLVLASGCEVPWRRSSAAQPRAATPTDADRGGARTHGSPHTGAAHAHRSADPSGAAPRDRGRVRPVLERARRCCAAHSIPAVSMRSQQATRCSEEREEIAQLRCRRYGRREGHRRPSVPSRAGYRDHCHGARRLQNRSYDVDLNKSTVSDRVASARRDSTGRHSSCEKIDGVWKVVDGSRYDDPASGLASRFRSCC